jgi:hypothetical protein
MTTEANATTTTTNGRAGKSDPVADLLRELESAVSNDNITEVVLVASKALVLAERWRPRPAAD